MNKIDIILIAKNDFANAGYLYAEALKSVGVKAEAWAVRPSPRGYGKHANLFRNLWDEVIPRVARAKSVQFMHSRHFTSIPLKDKYVTVFHGGSRYRKDYENLNRVFNPIVDKSIIQTGDLLGLGAKNEVWVLPCIDLKQIQPEFESKWPERIFAHYPHKGYVKGAEAVYRTMYGLLDGGIKCANPKGWKFVIKDTVVPWDENIKRMAKCDVYIEAVNPILRDRPYGEWGLTCLEAAALGKVVITHFKSWERYEREYGPCPLVVANDEDELRQAALRVLEMSSDELMKLKRETRAWAERHHSFKAVGKRLLEKVYDGIFS